MIRKVILTWADKSTRVIGGDMECVFSGLEKQGRRPVKAVVFGEDYSEEEVKTMRESLYYCLDPNRRELYIKSLSPG